MADEILRNGVPHQVTTSLVTHNAVLPQNIFIKDKAPALRDSDLDDVAPSPEKRDPANEFDQTSDNVAPQTVPSYPRIQRQAGHK